MTEAPWAVAYWQAEGVHGGEFQGIAPTGRTIAWEGINVFRVECGRIIESWSAVDEFSRLEQLVVAPDGETASAEASPAGQAVPAAASLDACPAPDRATAESAVRTLWDQGWNEGDAVALETVIAADVIHHRTSGRDAIGIEDLTARIAGWRATFPDLHLTYGPIIVDGDYAAAYWSAPGPTPGA